MTHYNTTLVLLSFSVAVIGSLMALLITRDALLRSADNRRDLVILASFCLGGVAIWSMHFIGMLAFDMKGMDANYNWWMTAVSFVVGVGIVNIGLKIMTTGKFGFIKLILAGFLVGIGVAAMHYTGMLSMQMQADAHWNMLLIAASIGIAVLAATVALWLAVHIKRLWQMTISAFVMGIAVCGMHYTGMAAVDFVHNPALPIVEPMSVSTSIFSLFILVIDAIIVVLAMAQTMAETNQRKLMSHRRLS